MRQYVRLLFALSLILAVPSAAWAADSKYIYAFDIGGSLGFHFFGESDDMIASRKDTLEKELLFKNRSDFYSRGVTIPEESGRLVNTLFTLEGTLGLKLYNFPYLKKYPIFKRVNGVRVRGGMSFYPFAARTLFDHSGKITFITPNASAPELVEKNYNAQIKVEESLFLIIPNFGAYYYHENGIEILKRYQFFREHHFVPFAGLDMGLMFANGMRKYMLDSDPLTISGARYRLSGRVQENFVNDPGYMFAPVVGAQLQLHKFQFVSFKMGYLIQGAGITMTRRGGFTEKSTLSDGSFNYTYTDSVTNETKEVSFGQSGFFFQFGYSVALL